LIFNCKELDNDADLASAGVGPNSLLFVVLKLQGVQHVVIRTLDDKEFVLEARPEESILDLKQRIFAKNSTAVDRQRLIANGKELQDHNKLFEHFLQPTASDRIVIHLLVRPVLVRRDGGAAPFDPTRLAAVKQKLNKRLEEKAAAGVLRPGEWTNNLEFEPETIEPMQTFDDGLNVLDSLPQDDCDGLFAEMLARSNQIVDLNGFTQHSSPDFMDCSTPTLSTPPIKAEKLEAIEEQPRWGAPAIPVTAVVEKPGPLVVKHAETPVIRKGVKTEFVADEKLRKRLLKNRLSAERSRQRKQAYMEELEYKLGLERSENTQLRNRVQELESALSLMMKLPGVVDSAAHLSHLSSLQALPLQSA